MPHRIEPIRPRVEPVPLVRRGSERDPYEERRRRNEQRPPKRRRPAPDEAGDGHVDVRA